MTRIRPPVRGFGPVASGAGVAVGAALQGAGQALGAVADLRTKLELLDIREQEQIDRLERAQFEKVERSEAIAQSTAKQIARNEAVAQILDEAKKARDYGDVQKNLGAWEKGYDQNLFPDRSQEFREIFETIDRSASVRAINMLSTAVQAGNLGIIRDNYQIAADNFVESVGVLTDPAEINEFFDALEETGVGMGMRRDAVDAVAGGGRRDAMDKYVRSLSLIDGLAALSDEDVAGAFTERQRELLKRDLNTKANILTSAQGLMSAAHERITGINIADALREGESATALSSRIENDEDLSPTRRGDMLDLIDAVSAAREKGPQPVDFEIIKASEELLNGLVERGIRRVKAIRDGKKLTDEDEAALLAITDDAVAIYQEAVLKEARGEFRSSELVKLQFKMWPIIEGPLIVEEVAKKGPVARLLSIMKTMGGKARDVSPDLDLKVPRAIVSEEIGMMFLGEGNYGGLSSEDKASMELFLISQSRNTDGSDKPLPREEASAMAQKIFTEAERRVLIEEKGVSEEAVEQVGGLVFRSGPPTTEARQQPLISGIADSVRESLANGKTMAEIEEFMQTQPGFTQEVFDRAAITVQATQ